jgi:hypothetical protein
MSSQLTQSPLIFSRSMTAARLRSWRRSSQSKSWLSLNFLHQPRRLEGILRLPELQHDEAADERLVVRPRGEHAEIIDVPYCADSRRGFSRQEFRGALGS